MRPTWQLAALAANGVLGLDAHASGWVPGTASSSLSSAYTTPLYTNSSSTAASATSEETVYVTEVTTSYTTVCPTTSVFISEDTTSTSTYLETSTYSSIITQV